ncbi:zinc finger protein-like [Tropilaelaps mercedesae]|uniref:Zinc finger protein-like n=1 Tax=Tropilaelaps mercedesae TaxID=418985 RepID=A0A1V9XRD3_9ACAR|nr:zinc finger protein-like [Tropilaelaps mercedesae]
MVNALKATIRKTALDAGHLPHMVAPAERSFHNGACPLSLTKCLLLGERSELPGACTELNGVLFYGLTTHLLEVACSEEEMQYSGAPDTNKDRIAIASTHVTNFSPPPTFQEASLEVEVLPFVVNAPPDHMNAMPSSHLAPITGTEHYATAYHGGDTGRPISPYRGRVDKLKIGSERDCQGMYHCHHCTYSSLRFQHMEKHYYARHAPVKPFSCRYCLRGFPTKDRRDSHERSKHTFEKPYSCKYCSRAYPAYSQLHTHIRAKHLDQLQP